MSGIESLAPLAATSLPGIDDLAPALQASRASMADPMASLASMPSMSPTSKAQASSFSAHVAQGLDALNHQMLDGQLELQRLALGGDGAPLHRVMMGMEDTRLQFQLMLQVRSRLLESWQEIMRMPL